MEENQDAIDESLSRRDSGERNNLVAEALQLQSEGRSIRSNNDRFNNSADSLLPNLELVDNSAKDSTGKSTAPPDGPLGGRGEARGSKNPLESKDTKPEGPPDGKASPAKEVAPPNGVRGEAGVPKNPSESKDTKPEGPPEAKPTPSKELAPPNGVRGEAGGPKNPSESKDTKPEGPAGKPSPAKELAPPNGVRPLQKAVPGPDGTLPFAPEKPASSQPVISSEKPKR